MQEVWPVHGKEIEPGRDTLKRLQFFTEQSSPCTRSAGPCGSNGTGMPSLVRILRLRRPVQSALSSARFRTSSFAIFHTYRPLLTRSPLPAAGHTHCALHPLKCDLHTSAMEINRGSATWGTSSWKTCSTPLWCTSVHTKRERWRGDTVVLLLVSIHLRSTGLRPVCARASAPGAYSYTFSVPQILNLLVAGNFDLVGV